MNRFYSIGFKKCKIWNIFCIIKPDFYNILNVQNYMYLNNRQKREWFNS